MWVDKFERRRATIRTADFIVSCDKLADVVIDMLLAEAFSALTALTWINHDVLAQDAVEQCVVIRCLTLTSVSCC